MAKTIGYELTIVLDLQKIYFLVCVCIIIWFITRPLVVYSEKREWDYAYYAMFVFVFLWPLMLTFAVLAYVSTVCFDWIVNFRKGKKE